MHNLGTCLLVLALIAVAQGCKKNTSDDTSTHVPAGKQDNGTFTVSRETTYITEPLDADGFIDYPAALNAKLLEGVTPENNANVLIVKAVGPTPQGHTLAPKYYELLGMSAPPEQGNYLVAFHRFAPSRDSEAEVLLKSTTQVPWTEQRYPEMADWLKANEQPLGIVVEASKRTHYFNPLLPTVQNGKSRGLFDALTPTVEYWRVSAGALTSRAMLWIGNGDPDKAWQDLLTVHRLARLVGQGGTLIEGLVGFAIEMVACKADMALLSSGLLDPKRLEQCLMDLRKLKALPDVASKLDLDERFMCLDALMNISRYGFGYMSRMGQGEGGVERPSNGVSFAGVNWDPAFKDANRMFDRMVAMAREKDRRKRVETCDQLEADIRVVKARSGGTGRLAGETDSTVKGQVLGDVLIPLLLPGAGKVLDARDKAQQLHNNTQIAFALTWYQRTKGHYPKTLEVLAPEYLTEFLPDIFSDAPLVYQRQQNGFLLYSVGVNGIDDEGRGPDSDPPGDDIAVIIPIPEPQK